MKIGILAVQGDFEAHAAMLARLGADTAEVRTPDQLEGCDGLILPGGESTTQLQFLQEEGLADAIAKFAKQGGAIFGTCAGAILLATEVEMVSGPTKLKSEPLEMVFIRGPIIERAGPGVNVLAEYAGKPALVERDQIMAATFHPELTDDTTVHQHFLRLVASATIQSAGSAKS